LKTRNDYVVSEIRKLVPLYAKVKEVILLSEYEEGLQLPLASVNELRNCLDHIMRTLSELPDEQIEHELIEAKAHLYRAGNDAYEILVMHKLTSLHEFQRKFDKQAIKEIYPNYFQVILPLVASAKIQLAKVRSLKPDLSEEENTFSAYETITSRLVEQVDLFQQQSIGIIDYEQGLRKKRLREKLIDYLVGGLVVGMILLAIQAIF
jgi:hypothetical protein